MPTLHIKSTTSITVKNVQIKLLLQLKQQVQQLATSATTSLQYITHQMINNKMATKKHSTVKSQ